jgi:CP family cyanate transporter-like MFS transporter
LILYFCQKIALTKINTPQKKKKTLLLIGILLIAVNLRPSLAGIGPLVSDIKESTGLSNLLLGFLTTLPLIAFAVVSMLAPVFTKKFGIGRVLFAALILLTAGILIRSVSWLPALYIGTLLLGVAIAFGNVLLPTLTKQNFPANSGIVTSLYSSTIAIGAALSAGISVPLTNELNLGWRGSLRIWATLSFIAFCVWIPQLWRLKRVKSDRDFLQSMRNMMKQRLAWKVALFMGLQSFTFYVVLAWLPALLISRGYDNGFAGWMLSLSQATGILGSMLIPFLAGKQKNQRSIVAFLTTLEMLSLAGLLFFNFGSEWIWISILGFVLGGSFGLALLLLVLRAGDTETTTELSGMAQSIGYFIAASGPVLIGSIFDYTGSWDYLIIALIIAAIIKLFMGLEAGKQGTVSRM